MIEVLNVFLKDKALEALEGEADLLMIGELLEALKALICFLPHNLVDLRLQDILTLQEHLPIADHQDSDVLPGKGRLVEVHLEVIVKPPKKHLLDVIMERLELDG
jgi:hypothetical protein